MGLQTQKETEQMGPIPVPDYIRNAEWCDGTQTYSAPDGFTDQQIPPAEGASYPAVRLSSVPVAPPNPLATGEAFDPPPMPNRRLAAFGEG